MANSDCIRGRGSGRFVMQEKTCVGCGSVFIGEGRRKYCSRACFLSRLAGAQNPNHRHGRNIIKDSTCPTCGISFSAFSQIYCSRKCVPCSGANNSYFVHGRAIRRDKPCEWCSTTFVGHDNNRFCSRRCKGRWNIHQRMNGPSGDEWRSRHSLQSAGAANVHWRGGRSQNNLRYAVGWTRKLRAEIMKRDGNHCVTCKGVKYLVVHHRDLERSDHSHDNLITLCRKCHTKVHLNRLSLLP